MHHALELPELRTNWKVSASVISLHLLVIWLMTFSFFVAAPKQNVKKLIVHTVSLAKPVKPVAAPAMPKPQTAPPVREPEPVAAPAPEPEPLAPAPKAEKEKTSAPAPTPAPAPKPAEPKKKEAIKPKPASKPTPKPVSKPASKPISKSEPKKKEVAKPKPAPKPDQKAQEKAKADQIKADKARAEKAKAEKERAQQENAKKEQARKQQALLDKALSSLNSASKIEGKKATVAASAAKSASSKGPSSIGSLSSEALVAIDASEVQNCTPAERTYYDELVSRLRLSLKLPDYGEVKLQLTVSRAGKVISVKNVKSKSSKNSDYIQKALPKLHLPPFGQNFTGENEHTFRLTLSNELSY